MSCKDPELFKVSNFLKSSNVLQIKNIRDLKDSCCLERIKVIDMDYLKEEFNKKYLKSSMHASCDAIYIRKKPRTEIIFVEMTDLKSHYKNKNLQMLNTSEREELKKEILLDMKNKVVDSFNLFMTACGFLDLGQEFYKKIYTQSIRIKFLLYVNSNYEQLMDFRASTLDVIALLKYNFMFGDLIIDNELKF